MIFDLKNWFSRENSAETQSNEGIRLVEWNGRGCEPITVEEYMEPQLHPDSNYRKLVKDTRSFTDLLAPRIDLNNNTIGLQDLTSTGKMFDVVCGSTEARPTEMLSNMNDRVCQAIGRGVPELATNPWIIQWFVQDDSDNGFRTLSNQISSYAKQSIRESAYSKDWLRTLERHFHDMTATDGLFPDSSSIGGRWRGKSRRIRLCIWRKNPIQRQSDDGNIEQVCTQLINALGQADVQLLPTGAKELYEWLTFWFVPSPDACTGFKSTHALLDAYPWNPSLENRSMSLFSNSASSDISRASLHGAAPWTWKKPGIWWFRGQPSRFITLDELTGEPEIGHLTGERRLGDSIGTLWDQMPEKSIWSMTIVYTPQSEIEEKILSVRRNSVGDDPAAAERRNLANSALTEIARGNTVYRVFAGVFLFGSNLPELNKKTEHALGVLAAHKLKPIFPRYDPIALDSYIRALPFGFDPDQDSRPFARRARLWYSSHLGRVVPAFGRSKGTGYPGCILFNRGAEPITFDPLNPTDREKNAHSLIIGPTGSGKTAFLIYFLLHTMAVHRPRILLISALPTFGLFADHCEKLGLSIHRVRVDGRSRVALPPFKHAQILLNRKNAKLDSSSSTIRDPLGEMEIQARLMITGGQSNEENNLRRDDLDLIRIALMDAAKRSESDKRDQTMTSDLVSAFRDASDSGRIGNHRLTKEQKQRAARMAGAVNVFCTGLNGELFDREGDYWPATDITVVELGLLARRGYEDRLAVALTGLFSMINNEIEANQYQERQTIVVIDEAHVLLQNPLISPYVNRISAMWRTFGAWLWIATQNLRQFPDNAKELLNQPEWWFCLSLDKDEIDQLGRFKSLTQQQKSLLQSARKSPGRYTEGTVISARLLTLFRNAPPAIALALSQTEKSEKAERAKLMKEKNISEIDAAYLIAESIRIDRSK